MVRAPLARFALQHRVAARGTNLGGQVGGPCVHQPAPPGEQIAPRVGPFDLVPHGVRERRFHHGVRRVRAFRRPIPKTAAEAVRHGFDAAAAQEIADGSAGESAASDARKRRDRRPRPFGGGPTPRRGRPGSAATAAPGARSSPSSARPGSSTPSPRRRSRPMSRRAPRRFGSRSARCT